MKQHLRKGIACLLIAALAVLSVPACARRSAFTATYLDVFDTVLTITVGAISHEEATTHANAIHGILSDLHRQFDIYNTYDGMTNLYDLNHAEGKAVSVTREMMDILLLGKAIYGKTDGAVNLCLGAVTSLWHDAREAGDRLPESAALEEARKHTDPADLILDETAMTACLADPATTVDVGAIAKGYVLAKVYDYAVEAGLDSLLVNLGGQTLAVGEKPNGGAWEITVPNPAGDPQRLTVTDAVVATSGDYERTFTVNGKAYHHLIDPTTGYPSVAHRAATVVLPLSHIAESDALSTALFLLPDATGAALTEAIPDAAALWISADGTVTTTEGWGK